MSLSLIEEIHLSIFFPCTFNNLCEKLALSLTSSVMTEKSYKQFL